LSSHYGARPAWAEINLDHIAHNIGQFRNLIGAERKIMAVVKADGYGHGAVAVAKIALEAGADCLAVAFVEEGIELRRAGIEAPVLLLGYTDPVRFPALVEHNLTPTVFGLDTSLSFSRAAVERGIILPLQLKIDTGMGRIGLLPDEAVEVIRQTVKLPGLRIEGLLTHLASADETDPSYTDEQLLLFDRIVDQCRKKDINIPLLHAANSAAAIYHPLSRYNMIRLGISLYGYYPSLRRGTEPVDLLPALTFKSRIVYVKKVPEGTAISYGCTFRTSAESVIATVPVGYADGYSRLLSNRGEVLIRGVRTPIVGRVCMDHLMVDVTHIPGVSRGDEVVLYGRQGGEEISIEEAAALIGTVHYELLCSIDKRVPRLYFRHKQLVSIHDFIEGRAF